MEKIIRQAEEKDIPIIENILYDVVKWMMMNNINNLWNKESIMWTNLQKSYKIKDFYIEYVDNIPAGCMALTLEDSMYWPDISFGESLFLHKLAVKRQFSGTGLSGDLIKYACKYAQTKGCSSLRLDCNYGRMKLRSLYERYGFKYIRKVKKENDYKIALYSLKI